MTVTAASTSAPEEKLLLTVEEAVCRLGISRTVMYRLVSSGLVESVREGRLAPSSSRGCPHGRRR
jgi:excisionase family DNA binding protein